MPAGWGMPFHIAMVYRGARVGGLRELRHSDFEMYQLNCPAQYPDTGAGKVYEEDQRTELEATHRKKPPAKRVNYDKLAVPRPFHCPWNLLLCDWCRDTDSVEHDRFAVMRDRTMLYHVQDCINKRSVIDLAHSSSFLLPVKLRMLARGCCESLSSICIPTGEDLARITADAQYPGPTEKVSVGPTGNRNELL